MFILPDLPFAHDALEPVISARTMSFHYDKHHATYVKTLNDLLDGAGKTPDSLEAVIRESAEGRNQKLYNNAAQAWNHSFFWESMSAERGKPSGALAKAIDAAFGDLDSLKTAFVSGGVGQFGSGWVWLAVDGGGAPRVWATHDADDTVTHADLTPLLVCDLWEHAYYLDHQNNRKGFLEAWFDALPNWDFAAAQYAAAQGDGEAWRYPAPKAA